MSDAIFFYRTHAPYGAFSNFWSAEITIDGGTWHTSEHYFQAAKFFRTDPAWAEMIRQVRSPMEAAQCGRSRAHPLDPQWGVLRNDHMRLALLEKFTAHPALQAMLLETGERDLVEHTGNDAYWGDGGVGQHRGPGRNMLGVLLCGLREIIRAGRIEAHRAQVLARLPAVSPQ